MCEDSSDIVDEYDDGDDESIEVVKEEKGCKLF